MIRIHESTTPSLSVLIFFKGTPHLGDSDSPFLFVESERIFSIENNADTLVEYDSISELDTFFSSEIFAKMTDAIRQLNGVLVLSELVLTPGNLTVGIQASSEEYLAALERVAKIKMEEHRSLKIRTNRDHSMPKIFEKVTRIEFDWAIIGLSRDLLDHTENQPIDVDRFTAIQNTFLTIPPMLSGTLQGIRHV